MADFYIRADHFVLAERVAGPGFLAIEGDRFGAYVEKAPAGAKVVDRSGCWVAPGFVDAHIHGYVGHDVMDCDAEGVAAASEALAKAGTTTWTPTTLTAAPERIGAACAAVYEAATSRSAHSTAARIGGIFLEGPFFSARYAGAQNPAFLRDPDAGLFRSWQEEAHGLICRSSLAPERAGSLRYINELINMGVAVALGHSAASFEEAVRAVGAGASSFVHAYNAMSPLHHREPGMVGCAFATPAFAELICDGHHVAIGAMVALINAKGWDHVALITDCLACGGMPEGGYDLAGLPITLGGGVARLTDGTLAGSAICLAQAVSNVYDWGVVSAEQAIRMASEVPARMSLIDDQCGIIVPGRLADLNVLGRELVVEETYVGGKRV